MAERMTVTGEVRERSRVRGSHHERASGRPAPSALYGFFLFLERWKRNTQKLDDVDG